MKLFTDSTGNTKTISGFFESKCEDMISSSTGDDAQNVVRRIHLSMSEIVGIHETLNFLEVVTIKESDYLWKLYQSALEESRSNFICKFGQQL